MTTQELITKYTLRKERLEKIIENHNKELSDMKEQYGGLTPKYLERSEFRSSQKMITQSEYRTVLEILKDLKEINN